MEEDDDKVFNYLMSLPLKTPTNYTNFLSQIKKTYITSSYYYFDILHKMLNDDQYDIFDLTDLVLFILDKLTEDKIKELFFVARKIKYIKEFLNYVDIDTKDENGKTLLNIACKKSDFDLVKFLLENNANQSLTDDFNRLPLHRIIGSKERLNIESIFFLLIDNFKSRCEEKNVDFKESITKLFKHEDHHGTNIVQNIFNNIPFIGKQDIRNIFNFIFWVDPNLNLVSINYLVSINSHTNENSDDYKLRFRTIISESFLETCYLNNPMFEFFEKLGGDINAKRFNDSEVTCTILSKYHSNLYDQYLDMVSFDTIIMTFFILLKNVNSSSGDYMTGIKRIIDKIKNLKLSYLLQYIPKIKHKEVFHLIFYALDRYEISSGEFMTFINILDIQDINNIFESYYPSILLDFPLEKFGVLLNHGLNPNFKSGINPFIISLTENLMFDYIYLFLKYNVNLNVICDQKTNDKKYTTPLTNLTNISEYRVIKRSNITKTSIDKVKSEALELLHYIIEKNKHFNISKEQETYQNLMDPITYELLEDPLTASDGYTYSRETLKDIFIGNQMSPFTRRKLIPVNNDYGIPNVLIKSLVERFKNGKIYINK
uniref:U-box domain-containing protein n=1 Tax=viral metagenome TaxID=1070528 RepID=A0A6C0BDI0_9ZZZZ